MNTLDFLDKKSLRDDIPEFRPGDTLNVNVKVIEGSKERVQVFEGTVIAMRGDGVREMFTVRRVVQGEGVERTFPVHSPKIAKLEVKRSGVSRRAKLYYLRDRVGKATRLRERKQKEAPGSTPKKARKKPAPKTEKTDK